MSRLDEAFKELELLEDIDFDINDEEDLKKLDDFLNDTEELDDFEMVVDLDAKDESELKDSYVGSLLLYCPYCHSIHYANEVDIIPSEEDSTLVNVDDVCIHCGSREGYEIKGKVAPYTLEQEDTQEDETNDEDDTLIDDETDITIEDEEDFDGNESLKRKNLKESKIKPTKKSKSLIESIIEGDMSRDDLDDNDNAPELSDGEDVGTDLEETRVGSRLPRVKKQIKETKLEEKPVYGLNPQYDSRKSFYGKAQVDTGDKGDQNKLYSYDTLVAEIKDGKPVVYGTYSQTTLRHIKDWLKQNGFKAENSKQIMNDYSVKNEGLLQKIDVQYKDNPELLKYARQLKELARKDGKSIPINDACEVLDQSFNAEQQTIEDFYKGLDLSEYSYKDIDEGCKVNENLKESKTSKFDKVMTILTNSDRYHKDDKYIAYLDPDAIIYSFNWEDTDGEFANEEELFKANDGFNYDTMLNTSANLKKLIDKYADEIIEFNEDLLGENLKESKSLKESAGDVYYDILDRAKMNIDAGYDDVDSAIWDAIDNGLIYTADEFEVIQDLFSASDLYTKDGEPVSTYVMEHIFNEIYSDVQDYYDEKHNNEDGEIEESLKKEHRTVEQIKESIKTKLDKTLTEAKDKLSKEAKFLKNAYEDLKEDDTPTWFYDLGLDSGLHLVVGKQEDEICVKIAFNSDDLQSDYDWDWEMPTYKDGEVAFVEDSLDDSTDFNKEAEYLVAEAKAMDEKIASGELLTESKHCEEIDESLFDNLVNKYCQRVYENVDNYKTDKCYVEKGKIVLEGKLNYKSGKSNNTKFIFEKKETKKDVIRYFGLNETFSKGKRAFILQCKLDNKKLLSESLTYNYKVKVDNTTKSLYGRVENKK